MLNEFHNEIEKLTKEKVLKSSDVGNGETEIFKSSPYIWHRFEGTSKWRISYS